MLFLRRGFSSFPPPAEAMVQGPFSQRVLSILSRAIPASYFAIACLAFWNNFLRTGKWTSLFWMVSEGVVVVLLVFRRPTRSVSRRPWDWLAGIAGSFFVLLVRPTGGTAVADAAGFALQLFGTVFQLYGKVVLGRSFGIVAANRGVVSSGPVSPGPAPDLPRVPRYPCGIPALEHERSQRGDLRGGLRFPVRPDLRGGADPRAGRGVP